MRLQRSTWVLIGALVVVVGVIAVLSGGSGPVSRPVAVPYSDEALYTALKTRTDCPGLLDDFNKASRDRERAAEGSEARRWAGEYWVAVGARIAEIHCASR